MFTVYYGATPQLQQNLCEQRSVSKVNFINMPLQFPFADDFFFSFHVAVLPEDGQEMFKGLERSSWAIVLTIRSIVLQRPHATAFVVC